MKIDIGFLFTFAAFGKTQLVMKELLLSPLLWRTVVFKSYSKLSTSYNECVGEFNFSTYLHSLGDNSIRNKGAKAISAAMKTWTNLCKIR